MTGRGGGREGWGTEGPIGEGKGVRQEWSREGRDVGKEVRWDSRWEGERTKQDQRT